MRYMTAIMTILALGGALAACRAETGGPISGASSSAPNAEGPADKGDVGGGATH